jgi:hypothetical protein
VNISGLKASGWYSTYELYLQSVPVHSEFPGMDVTDRASQLMQIGVLTRGEWAARRNHFLDIVKALETPK